MKIHVDKYDTNYLHVKFIITSKADTLKTY